MTTPQEQMDFSRIDKHACACPQKATDNVQNLAEYLASAAKNDLEKARAFFTWIVENIAYDNVAFRTKKYPDQSAPAVLRTRKSVCAGYAQLFSGLARATDLTAEYLEGYAKGYGYKIGMEFPSANHAWNAVKIDGQWRLLDCCWGRGVVINDDVYKFDINDFYFLCPPEFFVYTHLPEDDRWQLMAHKMTKESFEELVFAYPCFFQYGLTIKNRSLGTIRTDNQVDIIIEAPQAHLYSCEAIRGNKCVEGDDGLVRSRDGEVAIYYLIPEPGEYIMLVFVGFEAILEYRVFVSEATKKHFGFTRPADESLPLESKLPISIRHRVKRLMNDLINKGRMRRRLKRLEQDQALDDLAQDLADRSAAAGRLIESIDGKTPEEVYHGGDAQHTLSGVYPASQIDAPPDVYLHWLKDYGDHKKLMDPATVSMGLGVASDNRKNVYWFLLCARTDQEAVREQFDHDLHNMGDELLSLMNRVRARYHMPELNFQEDLQAAAQAMAGKCARSRTPSSVNTRPFFEQLHKAEYFYKKVNCVYKKGYESPLEMIKAWVKEPGVRDSMLQGEFLDVGLGAALTAEQDILWVMFFARPRALFDIHDADEVKKHLLNMVNSMRLRFRYQTLALNDSLQQVAQNLAQECAKQQRLVKSIRAVPYPQCIADTGYEFTEHGIYMAYGHDDPDTLFRHWMQSKQIRTNMLNGNLTQIGVGIDRNKEGTNYWTFVFAHPGQQK